jgi:hypothetical protein
MTGMELSPPFVVGFMLEIKSMVATLTGQTLEGLVTRGFPQRGSSVTPDAEGLPGELSE